MNVLHFAAVVGSMAATSSWMSDRVAMICSIRMGCERPNV